MIGPHLIPEILPGSCTETKYIRCQKPICLSSILGLKLAVHLLSSLPHKPSTKATGVECQTCFAAVDDGVISRGFGVHWIYFVNLCSRWKLPPLFSVTLCGWFLKVTGEQKILKVTLPLIIIKLSLTNKNIIKKYCIISASVGRRCARSKLTQFLLFLHFVPLYFIYVYVNSNGTIGISGSDACSDCASVSGLHETHP